VGETGKVKEVWKGGAKENMGEEKWGRAKGLGRLTPSLERDRLGGGQTELNAQKKGPINPSPKGFRDRVVGVGERL